MIAEPTLRKVALKRLRFLGLSVSAALVTLVVYGRNLDPEKLAQDQANPSPRLETSEIPLATSASCTDNNWTATQTINAPSARGNHTAVWTGTEMIVWGGSGFSYVSSGARYNPMTDSWTPTSTTNAPSARAYHTAVWTGSEMIVWGGHIGTVTNSGGRYNPLTNSWTPTNTVNAPSPRYNHKAVWTGTEMIVWGGESGTGCCPEGCCALNTGAKYNPTTDTWTPITTANAPAARTLFTAVWTGTEMIVWGGGGGSNTGGKYNPTTDTWTPTSTTGAAPARLIHSAIWTGNEMIVWGGTKANISLNSGGKYNPITDSWTPTTLTNAPIPRWGQTAVWTGSEMAVWGGIQSLTNTGGRYNPATDSWLPTNTSSAPNPRNVHTAIWTGTEMIVWGGYEDDGIATPTPGVVRPAPIPDQVDSQFPVANGGRYCAQSPPAPTPTPTPTSTPTASPTPTESPFFDVNPHSWNFGSQPVGSNSTSVSFTVSTRFNVSNLQISLTDPTNFSITSNTCGSSLPAFSTCNVSVQFNPTAIGSQSGFLIANPNCFCQPVNTSAQLTGTGTPSTGTPTPSPTSSPTPGPTCAIVEGFDNVNGLVSANWSTQNNSQPLGNTGWFQGNTAYFSSQSGSTNSYIAANYENGSGTATLSNWLLTPPVILQNGAHLAFWTRTVSAPSFPDRLQVRMSTNGTSTSVGSTATSVGDFTTLLLDINPTYTTAGYPNSWTSYLVTITGLGSPVFGRIAFRYFVENGGPAGVNSDYIGIDTVVYYCEGGPDPTPTSPTPTPTPTPNGKIVFSRAPGTIVPPTPTPSEAGYQLFSMNSNGTSVSQLTFDDSQHASRSGPKWSYDGTKIVCLERQLNSFPPPFSYYIKVIGGPHSGTLVAGAWPSSEASWSPDGTKIVFTNNGIFVVNEDGSNLTNLNQFGMHPSWSPDGAKIAFSSGGIRIMNPDGTNPINLTTDQSDAGPSWSADGTKIVFSRSGNIWVMNADGSNQTNLNRSGGHASWAPDGSKIAFQRGSQIYTINADGSNEFLISDTNYANFEPDWQWNLIVPTPTPTPPITPTPTPTPTAAISGSSALCASAVPTPTPNVALSNVTLTLTGTSAGSTSTDASGFYQFTGLGIGGSYTITPTKARRTPGSPGINTVDVVAEQNHALNRILLTGCRLSAAEAAGSAGVNTVDVLAIQAFSLGRTIPSQIGNVGVHVFSPASRTYTPLSGNQTSQSFNAIILGDVANPIATPPPRPGGPMPEMPDPGSVASVPSVILPELALVRSINNFTASVVVSPIDTSSHLVGFQGDITFDERMLTFASDPVQKAGLTLGNWNVAGNVLNGPGPIRTLRVSGYSTDLTPLDGTGVLFVLKIEKVSPGDPQLVWSVDPENAFYFVDADLHIARPVISVPNRDLDR